MSVKGRDKILTAGTAGKTRLHPEYKPFVSAIDSLDAGVYVSDMETYELLFVNRRMEEQFGDIVGKVCWRELQNSQDGPCSFCTNELLVGADGRPRSPYIWEFRNTIDEEWYECRDQAIRWHNGRLVRIEFATNITKRKLAEQELEKYKVNLEQKIEDRTWELKQINSELKGEIKKRKKAQKTIITQKTQLEQKNIALHEFLTQLEKEKDNLENKVISNIDKLIKPQLERLKMKAGKTQSATLELIEHNLNGITSSFGQQMRSQLNALSPREIEICNLIKNGTSSKEIARTLHLADATVISHRNRIRRKLGLRNTNANLTTFLNSM